MSTLADRLADLADDAPDGTGGSGGTAAGSGLWQQGRRYARRRRLETGALVVVLLLALGSVGTWVLPSASYDVAPADASADLRLPDQLFTPSPYLPGTDDVGPIGPLVAVFGAERRSWRGSSSNGLVGVNAAGDYAFLDLPDRAGPVFDESGGIALSDDGRFVAYWLGGDPEGEPNLALGEPAVGIAVLDAVTGEVERHLVATEHGLDVDDLLIAGDLLLASFGQFDQGASRAAESASASASAPLAWDLGSRSVTERPDLADVVVSSPTRAGDRLVHASPRGIDLVDPANGNSQTWELDVLTEGQAVVDPTTDRVAVLEDPDGRNTVTSGVAKVVRVGLLGLRTAVATEVVPGDGVAELVGWRDGQHVVGLDYRPGAYVSVDVTTGEAERLVQLPSNGWSPGAVLAADALRAPSYDASEPPTVVAPWLRITLGVLALLVAAAALAWWRRRARV